MNTRQTRTIGAAAFFAAALFVGANLFAQTATTAIKFKRMPENLLLKNSYLAGNPAAMYVITNLLAAPQPALSVPVLSQVGSRSGTYWTLTEPVPLPFDPFPELPVYEIGSGQFVIDDRSVDYTALNTRSTTVSANSLMAMDASSPPFPGGGSGDTNGYSYNGTQYTYTLPPGLKITPPVFTNGNVSVSIYDQDPSVPYDIYYCTNLASAIPWTLVSHGIVGQTNYVFANNFAGSQTVFFIVGSGADTLGQGLSDGFIALVLGLNPFAVSADGMTIGWKYLHGLNPAQTYTGYVPPATPLTITKPVDTATIQ